MSQKTSSSNLLFEQGFNKTIAEKLPQVLPTLNGKFIPAPGDFYYGMTYGANAYYNENALSTFDSTIEVNSDGIARLSNQKLSGLYMDVLTNAWYAFSEETQRQLDEWNSKAESQIASVLKAFTDYNFKFSDPIPPGGKIEDVFNQLTELYGPITKNCDNLPVTMPGLKNALSNYIMAAGKAYKLYSRSMHAIATLNAAKDNIEEPSAENGGLQINDSDYYVGFDRLPTTNQLIGSLSTDDNSLTVSLSGESFNGETCNIDIDSRGVFTIPISGLLNVTLGGSVNIDMFQYSANRTKFSINITYPGVTLVQNIPLALSNDTSKGWYSENILREIEAKTNNPHTDGYKLLGGEYTTDELFGEHGKMNYFKTFVISRQPTVEATFTNVNVKELQKVLKKSSNAGVKLFGFLPIGSASSNYSLSQVDFDDKAQSVTMRFHAPNVTGTTPLANQIAYIIGGVPEYTD